jgi:hypothetical protein
MTWWRGWAAGQDLIGDAVNFQLTPSHPPIIMITPTAARNLRLPPEATTKGLMFILCNNGAFVVTIQTSAGGALAQPGALSAAFQSGLFFNPDGVGWRGIVAASTQTSP